MTVTHFVGTKVTANVINERDGVYVGLFDSHRLAHVQDFATAVGIVTPSGVAVLLDLRQIGHRVLRQLMMPHAVEQNAPVCDQGFTNFCHRPRSRCSAMLDLAVFRQY